MTAPSYKFYSGQTLSAKCFPARTSLHQRSEGGYMFNQVKQLKTPKPFFFINIGKGQLSLFIYLDTSLKFQKC